MKSTDTIQAKDKKDIIEILNSNNINYNILKCNGCEKICISLGGKDKCCCNSMITVQTSNKNIIYRIYPQEILYIAIEERKSVLYLTDKRIETNYHIDYWKNILNKKCFAQPHYSYIVNLNYVDEVTKDFVKLIYGDDEYMVYTSQRKIRTFKKALLEFGK